MSIRALRWRRVTWRAAAAASLAAAGLAFLSCQTLLGIHDVELASGGAGGTGGTPAGNFGFTIDVAAVALVEGASVTVPVTVTPLDGFDSTVVVTTTSMDPTGLALTGPPLFLQGGGSGSVQIEAMSPLAVGSSFKLELRATSGTLSRTASVDAVVQSVPGTLDPSFGMQGVVAWQIGMNGGATTALVPAPGAEILVGGGRGDATHAWSMTGLRLAPDGGPDSTFGDGGEVSSLVTGPNSYDTEVRAIARAPGGLALFLGWAAATPTSAHIVLLRYYEDGGAPEVVGADNGQAVTDLGGSEPVYAAALMSDQRLVVAGVRNGQLYAARFADRFGSLDTTFAGNGWISPLPGTLAASGAFGVAVDSADRVLLAGYVENGTDDDVVLLRLTAGGLLDGSFGTGGVAQVSLPGNQQAYSVAIQPDDDSIVVAARDDGSSGGGDAGTRPAGMLVFRFTTEGQPDPSFGGTGAVALPANVLATSVVSAVLTSDGRIVVAGTAGGAQLARLETDGTLDTTFGVGGTAQPDLGVQVTVNALALAGDGAVLLCGNRAGNLPGFTDGFVARLFN